ncbi:hypothetical protein PVK06_040645 [Gossypium arboreum]|uniref:Uncharacterized protein n=1 Tax=Gossypium arboreum TaxID=29729 RepID=A0ABR0N619_GOSAR|nr:hypothetical protein PVK06_040645 [Gossypium arboreum]
MQARPWQGKGVPNMTGENGQARLEPIAMHKPPQEIFARYRELGPRVVGYISMGTGLTGWKIITPATSTGDRPIIVGESLWDNPTPLEAANAPHLRLKGVADGVGGSRTSKYQGADSARGSRTTKGLVCRWCPRLPHIQSPKVLMLLEAPVHSRHQGADAARGSSTSKQQGADAARGSRTSEHQGAGAAQGCRTTDVLGCRWGPSLQNV